VRTCSSCAVSKPKSDFRPRSRGGLDSYCVPCRNAKNRESYARHAKSRGAKNRARWAEKRYAYPAYQSQWNKDNREKLSYANHVHKLKRVYGMSVDLYEEMLRVQGGGCAICGDKDPRRKHSKWFAVDHDHTTNKVRALLCHNCNRGIGCLREDPVRLRQAASYLESFGK
jgi:hypothetical protein